MHAVSSPLASAQLSSGAAAAPSLPATGVTTPAPATGNTPDPIALHMQALDSLNICKAMLTANEPMYLFAQQWLTRAQQAIADLHAIDQQRSTEG